MENLLHARNMQLTEEEIEWALAIKQAVQRSNEEGSGENVYLNPLCDYNYAQMAIRVEGNVKDALDRIEKLQQFREEYKIEDGVDEGVFLLDAWTKQQPWHLLHLEYQEEHGHPIVVFDFAKQDPKAIDTPDDWRIFLGGLYYLAQAMTCNLKSIKEGPVVIIECEGMGFSNVSLEMNRRSYYHLFESYPYQYKEVSWIHTPLEGLLLHSFIKSFVGNKYRQTAFAGFELSSIDRIDGLYKGPTEEIAAVRLLTNLSIYLKIRYYNMQTFKLPVSDESIQRPIPAAEGNNGEQDDANANPEETNDTETNGQH